MEGDGVSTMPRFWKCPPLWEGSTAFVIGGGASLKGLDLSVLRGRRVIAVNNAFKLVPFADILFFADTRWWRWNGADLGAWGGRIVSTCKMGEAFLDRRIQRMNRDYRFDRRQKLLDYVPLSEDPTSLSGPDSGYMAINLAYHLGAARIVLLGFDMGFTGGEAHWHPDHPIETRESNYRDIFLPTYPGLIEALKTRGVEVIRCTPSRLDFVPEIPLEEALTLPDRQRG